jgi:hypothetical protein
MIFRRKLTVASLTLISCVALGQTTVATPIQHTTAAAARPTSPASHATGAHQGISVSGWWTIEVRNQDGSVAEHREFENELYVNGTQLLAYMLAGVVTAGEPLLHVTSSTGPAPCPKGIYFTGCQMYTNPNGWWAENLNPVLDQYGDTIEYRSYQPSCVDANRNPIPAACAATLVRTLQMQPNEALTLTLAGNIVAAQNGTIDTVQSFFLACREAYSDPSVSSSFTTANPQQCSVPDLSPGYDFDISSYPFTGTKITPINVSAGQTIQATVTFTFA